MSESDNIHNYIVKLMDQRNKLLEFVKNQHCGFKHHTEGCFTSNLENCKRAEKLLKEIGELK